MSLRLILEEFGLELKYIKGENSVLINLGLLFIPDSILIHRIFYWDNYIVAEY